MLVVGFPAGAFQANCYLLAPGTDGDCVLVDPGQGATERIGEALREHRLTPAAILATHGHLDHVHSAAEVAEAHDVPVWIHPGDRELLADPFRGLGPELTSAFDGPVRLPEPARIRDLEPGALALAGLELEVLHTPGHTPGSVVFRLDTPEGGRIALTGDTLFAGSIGRTDLPGGDAGRIAESLHTLTTTLSDETVLLPGHGPATTIGQERTRNPFLSGAGQGVCG
ncbi:MBL fold metallo-hydrolase [Amycolatopsis anabasis]|uniref:MBL fold metallo-hydrolase n=1 Tax=Amycolatopsis anabasis TaxID=1840409 RepID=UPI00131CC955|nr:MBL fold metallo-hydrolase [Amycolatopsis anabasis]